MVGFATRAVLLVVAGAPASTTATTPTVGARGGADSVRLSELQTLTLYNGRMTAGRRSSPVPQINCVGGTAVGKYAPPVIQCKNMGSDGTDIQWECKADLDNAYRFGETTVTCEGFSYADDPNVLAGSCGVEYTLDLTQEGRDQQQHTNSYTSSTPNSTPNNRDHSGGPHGDLFALIILCMVGVFFLVGFCSDSPARGHHVHHHTNGGGPPPAYTPPTNSCNSNGGYGYGSSGGDYGYFNGRRNTSSGPGFWTGAATGAMFGSALNSRPAGYSSGRGFSTGGSSWGSSGGGGVRSTSSSSSRSSGTRSASGFGGTRRR